MSTATTNAIPTWGEIQEMPIGEYTEIISSQFGITNDDISAVTLHPHTYIGNKVLQENNPPYKLLVINLMLSQTFPTKTQNYHLWNTCIQIPPINSPAEVKRECVYSLEIPATNEMACHLDNSTTVNVTTSVQYNNIKKAYFLKIEFNPLESFNIYFNDSYYFDATRDGWLTAQLTLI